MNVFRRSCRHVAVVVLLLAALSENVQAVERIPILIDTDVGAEIDDAFALGLAFGSDELDIRGITTAGDDTHQKAMLLCRMLTATGRRHIPVAAGAKPQPPRPLTTMFKYYYHPDALFNRTTKPEQKSAADFLHEKLNQQPGQLTLLALGPLTNVAQLLEAHAGAAAVIQRVILLESNLNLDVAAAQAVFAAGVPVMVVPDRIGRDLTLDDASVRRVFSPGTPLTRQVETLYQMWDRRHPPLSEALAVSLAIDPRFAAVERQSLRVDDEGILRAGTTPPNAQVVTEVQAGEFVKWYTDHMSSLVAPDRKPSRMIQDDTMPHRVHVAEDFDTDIERFWWMSGKPETQLLPPGSRRACRGVLTHDFDDLLMASRQMYSAVIFNPVPGPPMGKHTRLSFRYWLKGTDTLRVQIYSLTNGYHRHLVVKGLPQAMWQHATVRMTDARRPDGTGGPLSENERIDDIQFYVAPDAELVIDDIVLYDAAPETERRPFPRRIIYTGVFDTGKHGEHWRGDFELVANAGNFWRAIRSVQHTETGKPWIRLQLRGQRAVAEQTQLSFRYRLTGADQLQIRLFNSETGQHRKAAVRQLTPDRWAETTVDFSDERLDTADEIHFLLPNAGELLVDDVILYEPGKAGTLTQ